jgi:HSP20 family protein
MARTNPFEELSNVFDRMSRQFEETTETWSPGFGGWATTSGVPSLDLVDHDDEYLVTLDLPGYTKSDVTVRVTDHTLHVDAEREEHAADEGERYLRRERHHQSMHRQVRLPDEVVADDVTATMKHGVLTVTVPKAEPATTGRTIEIK